MPSASARPAAPDRANVVVTSGAKSTRVERTATTRAALKRPKSITRSCGSSRSSKRIRTRRSSATKTTLRVTTRYCSGRTLVQITRLVAGPKVPVPVPVPGPPVQVPGPPVQVPGPPIEVPAKPVEKSFRLTLLHNNDGESKYKAGDSTAGYGTISRFATVLGRLRSEASAFQSDAEKAGTEDKGTVLVSSGDNFLAGLNQRASFARWDANQGSWFDSLALDLLGYDAATIGNHEFDFGPARLAQYIGGTARTQFVSANTDMTDEPDLQALRASGKIADSTVVEKGGERIGIIGITPPETPSIASPGRVRFNAQVADVVNAEAKRLEASGVNKIVLSSHLQGLASDRALVPLLENVDIVIAGGGDDLLANEGTPLVPIVAPPAPPRAPTPVGPYPVRLTDKTGREVPVVTTAGEYNYVGRLTATFDAKGNLIGTDAARSGPVRVSGTSTDADVAAQNPTLKRAIEDPLVAFSAEADRTILGTSEVPLAGNNPDPIRLRESNLGNLVADAFRYSVADGISRGVIAANALRTVGLVNGGGIRNNATIAPGNISQGDTLRILPFSNVISRVPNVPATQLKEILEFSVARLPTADGRFGHVSGMDVEYDVSRTAQVTTADGVATTPGQRIRTITLDNGTKIVENGAVVTGAPAVNIATTDFTARGGAGGNGGDGYPFRKPTVEPIGVGYQQSLEDYLVAPIASGGLNRVITAAQYPAGGDGRLRALTPAP
ncbi:bifunctional metallophosphatase/5'-nucleotidase [Patulibacter americanus]|uniref:bifunctional metallophosphatase/5'-nucleotidase n=1 Tax=Patulibacter americanus TaxID=588672 RepID=UPI0012F73BAE|nr:bifunctional metallophosphatase/5'-nucleotidase [Patulibacter americanus]